MSAVDRVVDYMSGLPQAAEHAKTYATEFTERTMRSGVTVVNGVEEEKKIMSKGEREIIGRLNCPAKFTRHNFAVNVNLGVAVAAEKKRHVRREKAISLDFLGSREWFLEPAKSNAMYSAKESTVHLLDKVQKQKILSKCPNISGEQASDIFITSVHERISVPADMRHMMMKMYLILQDYNLGVTSKSTEVSHAGDLTYNLTRYISPVDRMTAVTNRRMVIDGDGFTASELGLLSLAAQQYPSTWYTHDNMYSKCNMEADDLAIVSDGDIDIDTSMIWGSPDRLYQMIWSIAAKLDCVPSLLSAFENMRGKCKMVSDIVRKVKGNRINSMVPLSYNMNTAFGSESSSTNVTKMPGYLSTSMSLVSDLLYGMTFEAAATCVGESLGAHGTLVSSKTPKTCSVINGIMRDYGLQHTSAEDNILLRNWDIMAGRPMTWDFGPILKDYVLSLAEMIINGADIVMPQILHTIPSLTAVNTAYGLSRGWKGPKHMLDSTKNERRDNADGLAAFAWMMGEREVRPQVFFNRSGKKTISLGPREFQLQSEADGEYGLGDVSFWLHDTLGGRVDENEETGTSLFRTEYAGTMCSVVFHSSEERWVLTSRREPPGRQTMRGEKPPADQKEQLLEEIPSPQPSGVPWMGAKPKKPDDIFKNLNALSRQNKIVPSQKPRHTRITSRGSAATQPYTLNGNEESEVVLSKRADIKENDEISLGIISVPGDGSCGVHAMVEDLKAHGMIAPGDVAKAYTYFSGELRSQTFHDAQELAALSQQMGMNMDLFDRDTSRVTRYGTFGPEAHTITVVKKGAHFDAGIVRADGTDGEGVRMVVGHLDEQQVPGDEFIASVKESGSLFAVASD
uniref:Putative protease n=1 Tax=Erysiphe necator associated chryso-like virus 1 TaxID=2744807 RepID=A0A8E4FQL0_9VIRU|nr:putative protease [Erysiphe necator associated chryso-like virus 1]